MNTEDEVYWIPKMYTVFVKHFLNADGMHYFDKIWYPEVALAISKQPGFISINTEKDKIDSECVHIKLRFKDQATLISWGTTKLHDELVDRLDGYRLRDWELATKDSTDENKNDLAELKWEQVKPRNVVY